MKQAATGTISGCLVWIITFGVIDMCILPVSIGCRRHDVCNRFCGQADGCNRLS
jgi:hypothetical protein